MIAKTFSKLGLSSQRSENRCVAQISFSIYYNLYQFVKLDKHILFVYRVLFSIEFNVKYYYFY